MATWTQKSPWRRIAITVAAMAVVLLLVASFRFVQSRGYFASVAEKAPAACHAVANISGVTAISPVHEVGWLIATEQGEIFSLANDHVEKYAGLSKKAHIVALSVGWGPDRVGTLVAVMTRQDGSDYIASFAIKLGLHPGSDAVQEIGRLTTDQLTDPADLVSIDGSRFYLVNRHKSHTALGRWLDDTFLLPRADVLYFDGMKFVTVAERLNSPSGIALSPDGSHLYVAQDLPRALASFSRSEFSGALDNAALLSLPAAPRKITVAPDGSLIVAAWPKAGAGAVYRIRLENGTPQAAELLYATKSGEITAASEANGHLLVGTPKGLIDCKL